MIEFESDLYRGVMRARFTLLTPILRSRCQGMRVCVPVRVPLVLFINHIFDIYTVYIPPLYHTYDCLTCLGLFGDHPTFSILHWGSE